MKKEVSLKEIVDNMDSDMEMEEYEEEFEEGYEEEYEDIEDEKEDKRLRGTDRKRIKKCHVSNMKINSDLEVNVGSKNKIIYVSPGKLQYFTASAISCSGDETIEIEFCGCNKKCVYGETFICGKLGHYKIVNSGIIFIPKHNLAELPDRIFPTDILHFKAKSKCNKDVEFVVVFTLSRCVDCECHCSK